VPTDAMAVALAVLDLRHRVANAICAVLLIPLKLAPCLRGWQSELTCRSKQSCTTLRAIQCFCNQGQQVVWENQHIQN
jgi:hypothetical protein